MSFMSPAMAGRFFATHATWEADLGLHMGRRFRNALRTDPGENKTKPNKTTLFYKALAMWRHLNSLKMKRSLYFQTMESRLLWLL